MNDKKEPIRRRKFDRTGVLADFKSEALRMVAEGQSANAVARPLNVSEKLLSRWKSEQKNQIGRQKADQTHEVALLKSQLRRVEMDRMAEATRHFKKSTGHLRPTDLTTMYDFIQKQADLFLVNLLFL